MPKSKLPAPTHALSESIENYLKAIYELQQRKGRVSTSALADKLKISPASVSGMIKKLTESSPRLIDYQPRKGVALTEAGMRAALRIIRRHRLLETYLQLKLGYSWDEVHGEACKLEHVISDQFEDRIDAALGYPKFDPHGDPIPTREGRVPRLDLVALSELEPDLPARIIRVRHYRDEVLKYLGDEGIAPNTLIKVVEKAPFEGPITVERLDAKNRPSLALDRTIANDIFVEILRC